MFKDLVMKSRSVRSFKASENIDRETLVSLIELCRYAPSSANLQALKFAAVSDRQKCGEIFALTKWAGYITDEKIPPLGHEPTGYIVIFIDKSITSNTTMFYKDVGICAQTIMLGATEKGLGGCMIGSFNAQGVKDVLSVGDNEKLEASLVLALGYPDEAPVITDADSSTPDSIKYYRLNGTHYVPKRLIEDILIQ